MIELLATDLALFVSLACVLGLLIGSFLNVVIHRLPVMIERGWREQCAGMEGKSLDEAPAYNLIVPHSACPGCGHVIPWYENVPVLSWLFLRGRCSACHAPISIRYPLVEALTGAMFAYVAWRWGFSVQTPALWLLVATLVALTGIDLDTYLLPDDLTLPLVWLGLLVNLNGWLVPLDEAVLGAVVGYLSLWTVFQIFRLLTGKEGMGFGDFKLLAALGAWLGWKLLLPIVLLASLSGALVGISLIALAGHDRTKPIPFGPWLAVGGLGALFWGQELLALWLG